MPATAAPTLAEVARRAGVSKATASRVLSDSPTPVDPETAARVRLAARELRYVPNPHARALARASSPSVCLLIHEVSNPFFSEIASGVLEVAEQHDRMVIICNTHRDPDQELRYVREMRAMRVYAILVGGSEFLDAQYSELLDRELEVYRRLGGKAVLMRPHPSGSVVIPDVIQGGRLVAEYLMGLGHTAIGVVTGPPQLATVRDRIGAFERSLSSQGLRVRSILPGDFTREGGRQATVQMLTEHPEVTAVFALNDPMAAGALRAAQELGLQVPDEVSIVGFNDVPIASDTNPPLTTVRLPLREMGRRALEAAFDQDDATAEPQSVVLDVQLIERGSAGPVPDGRS